MSEKRVWNPLESDPDILAQTARDYGVPDTQFHEIYGEELLDIIPQPVEAVVLLYPITENINKLAEQDKIDTKASEEMFFMPQRISNACGTMAILHTFMNTRADSTAQFTKDSPIHELATQTKDIKDPLTRAEIFEGLTGFETIHQTNAQEGQTQAEDHMNTEVHYITLIHRNGRLYELDGRKLGPVDHGETTPETLLTDGFKIIQRFMTAETENPRFAALAIVRE